MATIPLDLDDTTLLPPGRLAAVTTYLEMRAPAPLRPEHPDPALQWRPVPTPDVGWYRALWQAVGTPWLWFSRLGWDDERLAAIIHHPDVTLFAMARDGVDIGFVELDFRQQGACELSYFGVVPREAGGGAARMMMNRAMVAAWARPISRFWVHTCTLDHPRALDFYRRSGFVPYARGIEVAGDPRLDGRLPPDAAPQIPSL